MNVGGGEVVGRDAWAHPHVLRACLTLIEGLAQTLGRHEVSPVRHGPVEWVGMFLFSDFRHISNLFQNLNYCKTDKNLTDGVLSLIHI